MKNAKNLKKATAPVEQHRYLRAPSHTLCTALLHVLSPYAASYCLCFHVYPLDWALL